MTDQPKCKDCGGKGVYTGLNITETCSKCEGSGVAKMWKPRPEDWRLTINGTEVESMPVTVREVDIIGDVTAGEPVFLSDLKIPMLIQMPDEPDADFRKRIADHISDAAKEEAREEEWTELGVDDDITRVTRKPDEADAEFRERILAVANRVSAGIRAIKRITDDDEKAKARTGVEQVDFMRVPGETDKQFAAREKAYEHFKSRKE